MVDSISFPQSGATTSSSGAVQVRTEDVPRAGDAGAAASIRTAEPASELYAGMRRDAAPGNEPINLETVQRIKDLIAAGRYPVDLAKIARKMVELDLAPAVPTIERESNV